MKKEKIWVLTISEVPKSGKLVGVCDNFFRVIDFFDNEKDVIAMCKEITTQFNNRPKTDQYTGEALEEIVLDLVVYSWNKKKNCLMSHYWNEDCQDLHLLSRYEDV